MTMTTEKPITWEELVQLEPRLQQLYRAIKAIKDDKRKRSFCANAVWYGGSNNPSGSLKTQMTYLVGFHAMGTDKRLRTMGAYNCAYRKLYDALPDCRDCLCMAVGEAFGLR